MVSLLFDRMVGVINDGLATDVSSDVDNETVYQPDFNYRAIPWHEEAFFDHSPIILFTGSAGGGKSRLAAEKVHYNLFRYPESMWLMVRKTRESMRNSTVLFYASKIASRDKRIVHLKSDHRFEYPNGSILAYGGMKDEDQREQVRSIGLDGGLDGFWMEEANRFMRTDYEELVGRLRGKASPYQQGILSTNPDAPIHWINTDLILRKQAVVYYSGALDNPFNPPAYIEKLNMMTGVQRDRLVDGKWVQAEGVVYEELDTRRNITEDAEYNPSLPIIWGVDDGYAYGAGPGSESYHPRVILIGQVTALGGVNVFAERYRTGESSYETTIDAVIGSQDGSEPGMGYPMPDVAYIDSSAAMLRGALTVRGVPNSGATHNVTEGIRNVRRMINDGNGVTLLRIHPRCINLIQEMQMYRYDDRQVSTGDARPVKADDHGPDTLRYMTWHLRFGV